MTTFEILAVILAAFSSCGSVLHHLRGMSVLAVADVLGVPAASVRSDQRHARYLLETALRSDDNPEGNPRDSH
ncbi:hypothetical protein OG520_39660 (plasmid) [Streptomyces sp. NBC_00984]|uniref:hypothetical protein n=1 Tax=Streptomyces sp. NBC_00984 TaxID=2903700 RepID=UPI002F90EAA9|nr:hypothetical protein OG520_39660 [Streptomyces sp. NBC_00984]